jgi:hypothetical protein
MTVTIMHDPKTVAHEIRRPWPQKSSFKRTSEDVRWSIRLHHEHFEDEVHPGLCGGCDEPMASTKQFFPWWKPRSYSSFWRLAGRDYYWPSLLTIWHNEPHGHDGLTVCSRRVQDKHGKWRYTKGWKWHIWHWSFQVHPFQHFRRYLLTRCEVCGGKSRKGHLVNLSHSWDRPKGHFWQGEKGLQHIDCDRAGL